MKVFTTVLALSLLALARSQQDDADVLNYLNSLSKPAGSCECVPANECVNGVINTTGSGKFKYRHRDCCSQRTCPTGEVCCKPDPTPSPGPTPTNPAPTPTNPAPNPTGPAPTPTNPAPNPTIPTPGPTSRTNPKPTPTQPGQTTKPTSDAGCGKSDEQSLRGGFDDDQVGAEEFPWTIAVYKNSKFLCGGSLIHPRAVLAAAHNYRRAKPREFFIRAGEHDRAKHNQMFEYQESAVAEIVVHSEYDIVTKANDAALLFLEVAIETAPNVGFICLPPATLQPDPGTRCMVTGWGKTKTGGELQDRKKLVELPIVSRDICQAAILQIPRISKSYVLPESLTCAGGEPGSDTCKGDGGAPLVCSYPSDTERYYQAGITSWGVGCGEAGRPGVYAAVDRIRPWVDRQMAGRGYGSDTYTPPIN